MHPDLIPGLPLKTYGCCMAIGFFVAWHVVSYFCRRAGRDSNTLSNLVIALMVSGVAGSRIAYVIEHWTAEFAAKPLSVFFVWQGGLMFYGGFILALIVFFGWCFRHHERILVLADLFACVVPLGHAFGRIGCFFYGCCYGRVSDSVLAVRFPGGSPASYEQFHAGLIPSALGPSLPVLPTQLFESAANLALFGVLFVLYRRLTAASRDWSGVITGTYFCGYAVIRFGIEHLRGDPRAAIGPFSISQTISLGLFAAGTLFLAVAFLRRKR